MDGWSDGGRFIIESPHALLGFDDGVGDGVCSGEEENVDRVCCMEAVGFMMGLGQSHCRYRPV